MSTVTTIRLDLSRLREFEDFADQFPFAISRAMNWTAKLARKRIVAELPQNFTVRNAFTSKGVGIGPKRQGAGGVYYGSHKNDLRLTIFGKHEYLEAHNTGGRRPPGSQPISAVPVGARRNKEDTTKRPGWPMNLIKQGKAYRAGIDRRRKVYKTKTTRTDKNGRTRTRTLKTKAAIRPLEAGQIVRASRKHGLAEPGSVLWVIVNDSAIDLKKRWPVQETVNEVFNIEFPDQLYRAAVRAVRTARRRPG